MWYGEGDDMWFIDGEKQSSLIGTGTEDLFNTAWCPKEPYQHIYFGYPRVNNDVGFLGRTHVYRFFIQDPVFEKGLKATIEHGQQLPDARPGYRCLLVSGQGDGCPGHSRQGGP